jgi:thiol-disulfide isomerase/thioredoxin
MKYKSTIFLLILILLSCEIEEKKVEKRIENQPHQIVLISNYAPKAYKHSLKQDSVGQHLDKESGPYSPVESPTFTYFDTQNNVTNWKPKVNEIDTLVIPYYRAYLEISTRNVYTSIPNTYLIKNGDTLVIDYENKMPVAKITNRQVKDIELNYNSYRISELFNNKYPSHHKVFLGSFLSKEGLIEETVIGFYKKAIEDGKRENHFLDSLYNKNLISKINYQYRKDVLNGLLEKHKNNKAVEKHLEQNKYLSSNEGGKIIYDWDLSKTDSLMTYSFFRDYLNDLSKYNLSYIEVINMNSGGFHIDSRVRFDSILNDKRFNQTAKNYLLLEAYYGIGQNYSVKDKEEYFLKLVENTSNTEKINELQKKYKLDFSKSDKLILTDVKNDTITLSSLLEENRGKWLYIDFWASWCTPCRKANLESNKLKKEFEKENIEFIYLSLNDIKGNWKKAIELDKISDSQNYFIENGNTSSVIEKLFIKTVPHYLIYNPNGELVHGFADRPGEGAKDQLKKLMTKK